MLVERDRWLDSPIRRDGRVRDKAQMFAKVNDVLTSGSFRDLRRESDVLLLANREYDRLEAASVLVSFPGDFLETPSGFSEYPNRMTVAEDTLGFDQAVQVAKGDWFLSFYNALYASGYGYVLSDTALNPARWAKYRAVVVTSFDYMDTQTQQALVDFAAAGGTVVLGPKVPTLDSLMQPSRVLADAVAAGRDRIVVVEDLATVPAVLEETLAANSSSRVTKNDTRIDIVVHREEQSDRRVVFVCNPTAEAIQARVGIGTSISSATDAWSNGTFTVEDGELVLDLPPYTIEICDCAVQA